MAGHGAHAGKSSVYISERSRTGSPGPFWRRDTDVDSDRPWAIVLFIASGTLGWSLFGAVLAFAPGQWVDPALGVSSALVTLQYLMWWRLGSRGALLSPLPIRKMGRILGIPEAIGLVMVYGAALWVVIAAAIRSTKGGLPEARPHSWVALIGLACGCVAFVAVFLLAVIDRGFDYGNAQRVARPSRLRWTLSRIVPVLTRIAFVSATIAVLAFTAQALG
jgi:hypothetical protein